MRIRVAKVYQFECGATVKDTGSPSVHSLKIMSSQRVQHARGSFFCGALNVFGKFHAAQGLIAAQDERNSLRLIFLGPELSIPYFKTSWPVVVEISGLVTEKHRHLQVRPLMGQKCHFTATLEKISHVLQTGRVRQNIRNVSPVQCLSLPTFPVRKSGCHHHPARPWLQRENEKHEKQSHVKNVLQL